MRLDGACIVCFSNLDWDYLRYRKQHLMSRFARRVPVVYVNPPRALKAAHPGTWNRLRRVDNLWVLDPIVLPGVRRSPRVKRLNDRLIARAIDRIPELPGERIAWAYSPHARTLVDLVRPSTVVYDIADNYTVPSGTSVRDRAEAYEIARLAALERSLLERADLVFCVSESLAARVRAAGRAPVVVPNGCDFPAYASDAPASPRRSRPVVGYVGTVAPRTDIELLLEVARMRPEWQVEVVGPVSPLVHLDTSAVPPNAHFRGAVPYDDVPGLMRRFDVGVLPLREIPFATDCSPIQVYDYLAAGKPVVSTPVHQFAAQPDLVRTARGPYAFAAAIDAALDDTSPARVEQRRAFARRNSWDARVEQMLAELELFRPVARGTHAA